MQKTLFILAVFVAAVLAGFLLSFSSWAPKGKENFMQQPVGAPLNGQGIGPYDGVYLPGVAAGWLATEDVPRGTAPADSKSPPIAPTK